MLERERECTWTRAKQRDYMSALNGINTLAKQREGVRDDVTYAMDAVAKNDAKDCSDVNKAARVFRGTRAENRPYVTRTERLPNDRESASAPGQTMYIEEGGVRGYGKYIGGNDKVLKWAYADTLRPKQECVARPVLADRDGLAAKFKAARNDLAHFEQTLVYQHTQAFDQLTRREVLERHPGLDGVYKQFHDIKRS